MEDYNRDYILGWIKNLEGYMNNCLEPPKKEFAAIKKSLGYLKETVEGMD